MSITFCHHEEKVRYFKRPINNILNFNSYIMMLLATYQLLGKSGSLGNRTDRTAGTDRRSFLRQPYHPRLGSPWCRLNSSVNLNVSIRRRLVSVYRELIALRHRLIYVECRPTGVLFGSAAGVLFNTRIQREIIDFPSGRRSVVRTSSAKNEYRHQLIPLRSRHWAPINPCARFSGIPPVMQRG